jgi:TonB family protein
MLSPFRSEAHVSTHPHRIVTAGLALVLALSSCSERDEGSSADPNAAPASARPARADASPATAGPAASAETGLIAATREYAENGCATARRRLELCSACETPEQKPLRDLLLAYCEERESPSEARALYEAIISDHPNTEASVTAIMRVRQIDAAELPPLGDYAGPKPTAVQRHQPAYPTLAERAGVEGKVRLRFDVREDGSVANVRVVESTPPLLFDAVALYAVSSWTYQPGRAAESQQVVLRFDLPDAEVAAAKAAAEGEAAR